MLLGITILDSDRVEANSGMFGVDYYNPMMPFYDPSFGQWPSPMMSPWMPNAYPYQGYGFMNQNDFWSIPGGGSSSSRRGDFEIISGGAPSYSAPVPANAPKIAPPASTGGPSMSDIVEEVQGPPAPTTSGPVGAVSDCVNCPQGRGPGELVTATSIQLTPLVELAKNLENGDSYLAKGARKTFQMANLNCELGDKSKTIKKDEFKGHAKEIVMTEVRPYVREFYDITEARATHPFKKAPFSRAECPQTDLDLFVFDFGSQPKVDAAKKEINVFNETRKKGVKAYGLDCSGFVRSAILAAGVRLQKNVDPFTQKSTSFSTSSLMGLKDSCFKTAEFKKDESLKSGDLIVMRGSKHDGDEGHAAIVEFLDEDPFNVKASGAQKAADCQVPAFQEKMKSKDFKISILHSTGSFGGIGPTRTLIKDYAEYGENQPKFVDLLQELAIKACEANFSDTPAKATVRNELRVLRFDSTNEAACKQEPGKFKYRDKCLGPCPGFD